MYLTIFTVLNSEASKLETESPLKKADPRSKSAKSLVTL